MILGDFKYFVDEKGQQGAKSEMRAKGVGVTWGPGPGTGWKAAEVGRARLMGTGGTKGKALGKVRVPSKAPHADSGLVSGRKKPSSSCV